MQSSWQEIINNVEMYILVLVTCDLTQEKRDNFQATFNGVSFVTKKHARDALVEKGLIALNGLGTPVPTLAGIRFLHHHTSRTDIKKVVNEVTISD